jgi:putative MATE family efflux protein
MSQILTGNVKKQMFRLTLPSIGGMLAIMIFNLTDTYFVSKLGTDHLAAMGFIFPVVMIVGTITMGFSTGSTSIISRSIGAGDYSKARRTTSDGLFLTAIMAFIVGIFGYYNITNIFSFMGASGNVLSHITDYMEIWFLSAMVIIMPPLSDDCLRASGDTLKPFYVMLTCGIINFILDPLLIFGIGPFPQLGIKGAAIATIIARFMGMCVSLYFLNYHAKLIEWSLPSFSALINSWKQIIILGIPSAITHMLNPLSQAFYIKMAVITGGTIAVASLSAGTRIMNFMSIFPMAFGIAIIPFVGQNYGAGNHERVDKVRNMTVNLSFIYSFLTFILLYFISDSIASIFSSDRSVIDLCSFYLLFACLEYQGIYLCVLTSQMLNTAGKPKPVLVLNLSRVFLFILPCIYFGSKFFGFSGLVYGMITGNILAGIYAYITGKRIFKLKY